MSWRQRDILRDDYDYCFNVLMIGKDSVGRHSLVVRFTEDLFLPNFAGHILRDDFTILKLEVEDKLVRLQVQDSTGRFQRVTESYYRRANGIAVVYDISDRKSFDEVEHWMSEIKSTDACRLLVGAKADLAHKRAVKAEEGEAMARKYGIPFLETSAKESINVEEMFAILAEAMKKKAEGLSAGPRDGD
jgi:small GTP-binding protein